jgi:hypothetical protein
MMFWNKKGPPIDWIGRRVSYQSHAGAPIETGTVIRMCEHNVPGARDRRAMFVLFDGDQNAKLTFEHDLLKFQGEEL